MKKILSSIFLIFSVGNVFGQNDLTFNRIYNYPNSFSNTSTSIIPCLGGYVTYGSEIDSSYLSRVVISKIDTVGNLVWTKSYGRTDSNYYCMFPGGGGGLPFLGVDILVLV